VCYPHSCDVDSFIGYSFYVLAGEANTMAFEEGSSVLELVKEKTPLTSEKKRELRIRTQNVFRFTSVLPSQRRIIPGLLID